MSKTVKMDAPDPRHLLDQMAQGVIGQPLDRAEAPLKVAGAAPYAHEHRLGRMVYGVLVRATAARGTLEPIDRHALQGMDGILGVWSDRRFLRNPAQGTANQAPAQGVRAIAYFGQPVALVVAETFEAARHGAQSLALSIEMQDAAVNPEAAGVTREPQDGAVDQGDLETAMQNAEVTVDQTYRTAGHAAAAMEPHCSIAAWEGDALTLYGAYQMLNYNVNELADALGIPASKVRMLSPYVGGGFGSKLGIAPEAVAAAIAAQELGRPVCVEMSRQQVFENVLSRCETRQRLRLAASKDGTITGIGHESLVSNLPDEGFAEPVPQSTHFLYGGENRKITLTRAHVHRPPAGSVRAPGEAVGMPVLENAMDELAVALAMDPVELRKRNLPERHPERGIPFSSRKYAECMDEGARRFGWEDRNRTPGGRREGEWLIGHGMAGASRINITGAATARVTLRADGTVLVECDMTDLGTGTYTVVGQVAAELLGLPPARVTVVLGDSTLPKGPGSGGSWGASSTGSAVLVACESLRNRICAKLGCEAAQLILKDGEARVGDHSTPLSAVLDGSDLVEEGSFQPGSTRREYAQAGYGAYFCEVAVNSVTGETRVRRMLGVYAAGRILNRKTARSQCLGGMSWGIGMALTEELVHDPRDGHIVNRDFAEYHLPVNADVPQLDVVFLDERDDAGCPMQSKGIGELGFCGAAGAVLNAIYNATGVRVRDYPATLDKLLAGLPM